MASGGRRCVRDGIDDKSEWWRPPTHAEKKVLSGVRWRWDHGGPGFARTALASGRGQQKYKAAAVLAVNMDVGEEHAGASEK